MSEIHTIYGLTAASIPGIRDIAIVGWIAVCISTTATRSRQKSSRPYRRSRGRSHRGVACRAAADREAVVDIVNLATPGTGDAFVFSAPSFSVQECEINGERQDFYDYAVRNNLDLKQPLVTDLHGEFISVSFKGI